MNVGVVDLTLPVQSFLIRLPELNMQLPWLTLLIYDLIQSVSSIFRLLVVALFNGIPRCEGPVLLFTSVWVLVIAMVNLKLTSCDFFGLLMASRANITKTRPLFQKALGWGVVMGVQSALFVFMQCVMMLFSRTLYLLDYPISADGQKWSCSYAEGKLSTMYGRIFLPFAIFIGGIVTYLGANGFLIGDRSVTKEVGHISKMRLTDVRPKLAQEKDGLSFAKISSIFGMFPTTLGIWIDGWNVDCFLIKERATVYAREMEFPQVCEICGEAHIPYRDIMRSTGMQISLAYQLGLPYDHCLERHASTSTTHLCFISAHH